MRSQHLGSVCSEERLRALASIRNATTGQFISPEDLDVLAERERTEELDNVVANLRRED